MPNVINATSTGNGGLVSTGDDSGILNIQTNETTAITVDTSQNVGIGATSLSDKFTVGDGTVSADATVRINGGSNTGKGSGIRLMKAGTAYAYIGSTSWLLGTGTSSNLSLSTTGNPDVNLDSSGNLLVKKTASSSSADNNVGAQLAATGKCIFEASGDRALILNRLSDNGIIQEFFRGACNQVGNIQANTSSVAYNTSSDYRLKEDIAPMTGALAKVTQLKPVTYKWKSSGEDGQGFIAHELQAIVPDCVTGEKDAVDADGKPVYQGIDTSFLVATLTAALQETKALLDTQAETINALTARIVALEQV